MKVLDENQVAQVSGGWAYSFGDAIEGSVWGAIDGAMTGMAIGGKFGGAGWWGFGSIAQLVGYAVTPFISGAAGAAIGFFYGRDAAADVIQNYRDTLGTK